MIHMTMTSMCYDQRQLAMAYFASCRCGWRTTMGRATRQQARRDGDDHLDEENRRETKEMSR